MPRAATPLEKADIVAALQGMETSRRNGLYGRVAPIDGLIERAVALAKRGYL